MKYSNVLMLSDCIIDKDIGLLKVIQYYYRNTDLFFDGILDNCTLEQQQYLLHTRKRINPLSVIVDESKWDLIDNMLDQFMSNEYDRIVDLSCNTKLFSLVKLIISGETPEKCTILCNTNHEAEVITNRLHQFGHNGLSVIVEPDYSKVDISKYDELFIRFITELTLFRSVKDKMVYVSDQRLNYLQTEDGENVIDLSAVTVDKLDNTLYTFSLYDLKDDEIVG